MTRYVIIGEAGYLVPGGEGRTEHVSVDGSYRWDTREEAEAIVARLNAEAMSGEIIVDGGMRAPIRDYYHVDWICS